MGQSKSYSQKLKKNNSSETSEKVVKYNIKLGVISQIKNRKNIILL